jgi:hypothetical protein
MATMLAFCRRTTKRSRWGVTKSPDEVLYIRLVMGSMVGYFKTVEDAGWCEMLTLHNKPAVDVDMAQQTHVVSGRRGR